MLPVYNPWLAERRSIDDLIDEELRKNLRAFDLMTEIRKNATTSSGRTGQVRSKEVQFGKVASAPFNPERDTDRKNSTLLCIIVKHVPLVMSLAFFVKTDGTCVV